MSSAAASSGNGQNNAAMMSLWNKFSDLQQQAEQCRHQRGRARQAREQLEAELQQLVQTTARERQAAANANRQARARHVALAGKGGGDSCARLRLDEEDLQRGGRDATTTPTLTQQLRQSDQAYSQALTAHEHAQRQLDQWKAWKVDQLQQPQQHSPNDHSFWQQCCTWRLQAVTLGLPQDVVTKAAIQAAVGSRCHEHLGGLLELEKKLEKEDNSWDPYPLPHWNEDDPATWILPEDDHDDDYELQEAVKLYRIRQQQHAEAVAALETWKTKHTALQNNCQTSRDRRDQLQAQCQRLSKDGDNLRQETAQLELLTEEDTVLANTYRIKMRQRHQQRSTGRHVLHGGSSSHSTQQPRHIPTVNLQSLIPPPQDHRLDNNRATTTTPSATTATTTTTTTTRNPYANTHSNKRHSAHITPAASASACTAGHHPQSPSHPRRQELMNIVVGSSSVRNSNEQQQQQQVTASGHRLRRDRRFGCQLEIGDDETMASSSPNNDYSSHDRSSNNNSDTTIDATAMQDLLADDDDDDMDELLSFRAFSKRSDT